MSTYARNMVTAGSALGGFIIGGFVVGLICGLLGLYGGIATVITIVAGLAAAFGGAVLARRITARRMPSPGEAHDNGPHHPGPYQG